MSEIEIRIERLAPMRVACLSVRSETPENDSINGLLAWARRHGTLTSEKSYRIFGYDNCKPHPNHVYTAWITVGPEVQPEGEVSIKDFPGGLYAVTRVTGVENIGPGWKSLVGWCERNGYRCGEQQCLEEQVSPAGTPLEDLCFDLFESVAE